MDLAETRLPCSIFVLFFSVKKGRYLGQALGQKETQFFCNAGYDFISLPTLGI